MTKPTITLKTIADQLGYSVSTVSRVLNGLADKYRISKETQQAITDAAQRLDFSPNPLARGLRINKSNTIGLVIPDISNPFFSSIARNVEHEARKHHYSIILCDTDENTALEIESLQLLQNRKVDGLIMLPVGQSSQHIEKVYQSGMPMVIIDRYFKDVDIPYVASDNYKGAFEAVSYLIQTGHTTIGCIQGLRHTMPNSERIRGYIEAHQYHNIPVNERLIVGDSFGEQNGFLETKLLIKKEKELTAIFALSNLISLGSIRALKEEGLRIPDDISIISFDDQPYSEYLSTPMTTISQQNKEMGQIAVKHLISQIDTTIRPSGEYVLLSTKLIKRSSVKILSASKNLIKQINRGEVISMK